MAPCLSVRVDERLDGWFLRHEGCRTESLEIFSGLARFLVQNAIVRSREREKRIGQIQ